jgi:predicted Zn-dependent protease
VPGAPLTAAAKKAQTQRFLVAGAAGLVVVVVLLRLLTAPATTARLPAAEARAIGDAFIDAGVNAYGGRRSVPHDTVTASVERVAHSLVPGLEGLVDVPEPRVVIVNGGDTALLLMLPDATIVVNPTLLASLGSEGELAALIAHGVAHVARGDVVRQVAPSLKSIRNSLSSGAAPVAASTLSAALAQPLPAGSEDDLDRLALRILRQAGWNPRNYAVALEHTLTPKPTSWATQHAIDAARATPSNRLDPNGRSGATEYTRDVLQPLKAPPRR